LPRSTHDGEVICMVVWPFVEGMMLIWKRGKGGVELLSGSADDDYGGCRKDVSRRESCFGVWDLNFGLWVAAMKPWNIS
jgi:hypothetical protein